MAYIGQSGRPITTRHREHMRYIRTNNPKSANAMHMLNNKHEYGTAHDMLELLKPCNKGLKMNCWESFYIQIYRQRNRLITEQLTGDYCPLYEQAYFPRDLQHIPWQYQPDRYTHTHTHRRVSPFSFILIIVNILESALDNSCLMGVFCITEWIGIQPHTDTLYNKCK
jgi:hypothetical protein